MHRHCTKLAELTENRGRWQHHWTSFSASGATVVADAPLALTNTAHQAENIAYSVAGAAAAPGAVRRRPRPRGAARGGKGGANASNGANAAAAPTTAAADQGAQWGNWQNAWGNANQPAGRGKAGRGKGGKGAGRGKGGRGRA